MWEANQNILQADKMIRFELMENGTLLSNSSFIDLLIRSGEFRQFFVRLLTEVKMGGYFWEIKPVSSQSLDEAFEFVLIQSSVFDDLRPNGRPFIQHFRTKQEAVSFQNLGKNARLVVPTPMSIDTNYSHLANFVRKAPAHQIDKLWQLVGQEFKKEINEEPRWLSTHGLGVRWVHIRIDSRPKYYHYADYKNYFNQ